MEAVRSHETGPLAAVGLRARLSTRPETARAVLVG
jgi:hypothetical protein